MEITLEQLHEAKKASEFLKIFVEDLKLSAVTAKEIFNVFDDTEKAYEFAQIASNLTSVGLMNLDDHIAWLNNFKDNTK